MKETKLRGKLLQSFYHRRLNADGWCPTTEIDVSGEEPVTRQEIGNVCSQLADYGLIRWRPLTGAQEGFAIGIAKITAAGVDVIDGLQPPPFMIDGFAPPRPGIDAYKALIEDAKKVGPDAAMLVETVGRQRADLLLLEAFKKQQSGSSFVKNSRGQNVIPRGFYSLIEADLRDAGTVAISEIIPNQLLAPIRVEERNGRIARVSDRDGQLLDRVDEFAIDDLFGIPRLNRA